MCCCRKILKQGTAEDRVRKVAVIAGIALVATGIIFSTISWIVLIDTQSVPQYLFGNLDGSITGRLLVTSNFFIFMPSILVGIPIMFYGISEKFSEKRTIIIGFLLIFGYFAIWLVNDLIHAH